MGRHWKSKRPHAAGPGTTAGPKPGVPEHETGTEQAWSIGGGRMTLQLDTYSWEEGCRVTETLRAPDRWTVHDADHVTLEVEWPEDPGRAPLSVRVAQWPRELSLSGDGRLGVAACVWDSALVLSAHLAFTLSAGALAGRRVVELGSGCGLAGLAAAQLGALVTLTDRECVVPLLQHNASLNDCRPPPAQQAGAVALQWGAEGYEDAVHSLAPVDVVVAGDCCYLDGVGVSPSIEHFVRAARGLLGGGTHAVAATGGPEREVAIQTSVPGAGDPTGRFALIAWEKRSSEVRAEMLGWLGAVFGTVTLLSNSTIPPAWRVDHIEVFECRL